MVTDLKLGPATVPIRDLSELDERDRSFIPRWDPDIEMDRAFEAAVGASLALPCPLLVVGPTGSGKTSTIRNIAAALNQPVRRVNLFGDIRSADLLGEKTLEVIDGESVVVWRDGPVAEAKRRGYWLLLDELDACPPNIAFVLQALLEPGNPLVIAANNGEVVEQEVEGPGLRIFATANTLGRGDTTGIYSGTNLLNEAFLDRWLVHTASYLSPDAEVAVLVRAGLPEPLAKKLRAAAELVRAGFDKGETTATLSTRRLVAWARLSAAFSADGGAAATTALASGYRLALENKLPAEERRFFGGVMQRVLGWPHG